MIAAGSEQANALQEMHEDLKGATSLHVQFNQTGDCISLCTSNGHGIWLCDGAGPPRPFWWRKTGDGAIKRAALLFRTNLMLLVGDDLNPKYPANQVLLWDNRKRRIMGTLSNRDPVKNVILTREEIIVILQDRIGVYCISLASGFKQDWKTDTANNPLGLCAVSSATASVMAYPMPPRDGENRLGIRRKASPKDGDRQEGKGSEEHAFAVHKNVLACIALSSDGSVVATASERGTIIRLFNTKTGTLLHELRRGRDSATIYSMAFDYEMQWLAVASDKGTVHLFALCEAPLAIEHKPERAAGSGLEQRRTPDRQQQSNYRPFAALAKYIPVVSALQPLLPDAANVTCEWSAAQIRRPKQVNVRTVVAFERGTHEPVLHIVSLDGSFSRCKQTREEAAGEGKLPYVWTEVYSGSMFNA